MSSSRPIVCIQGLGFVGLAMSVAVASAKNDAGDPKYTVIGVDLASDIGKEKVAAINRGRFPITSSDASLERAFHDAVSAGNLTATTDPSVYAQAEVIIVDVNLDVDFSVSPATVDYALFREAVRSVAELAQAGALILIETTVPPGTCAHIAWPLISETARKRGLEKGALLLAHSYERVMPGKDYFNSIVNFWRVYAGINSASADAAEHFLGNIINVREYPLTRLASVTASETAKVLENSYRAVNIAFIEEWGRFAETVGIDLFEVIDAIRMRPTHMNIRQPGFGVGGYCLTKDPLLGEIAARTILGASHLEFPFSRQAIAINSVMPLVSLDKVRHALQGSLAGKRIALFGISYRQDVADTRYSPSEVFVRAAQREGATIIAQDPLLNYWPELGITVITEIPDAGNLDAVVFAVQHSNYHDIRFERWLGDQRPVIIDANRVLSEDQHAVLKRIGVHVVSIGRGEA